MSIIEFDDAAPVRRRASSEGALLAREAIALVRPFNEQIGAWQAEAVRLAASAQRAQASGRYDAGIAEGLRTLLGYVEEQNLRFEAVVAAAPPKVSAHSRIADTRTALAMLSERLRRALPRAPGGTNRV